LPDAKLKLRLCKAQKKHALQNWRKITLARSSRVQGFSLLELLAVVATIATLAALLLPVLGKTKAKAQQTNCMSNLRQLGLAWEMYYYDNSGWLTEAYPVNNPRVWVKGDMKSPTEASDVSLLEKSTLYPYHRNTTLYKCPTDRGAISEDQRLPSVRSYSMNGFMGNRPRDTGAIPPSASGYVQFFARDSDLRRPSELWVLVDEDDRSIGDGFFVTDPSARVWFNFPSIAPYRHSYRYTLNFADGHAEAWSLHDPRTRAVVKSETEQAGNTDLKRLAHVTTLPK
jgi:type II secretory pathway pseudopilin PulG